MSKRTVEIHWGQAHNEHVEKLNKILKNSTFYGHTLEEMVKATYNNGNPLVEFNDASSVCFSLLLVFFFFFFFFFFFSFVYLLMP